MICASLGGVDWPATLAAALTNISTPPSPATAAFTIAATLASDPVSTSTVTTLAPVFSREASSAMPRAAASVGDRL